MDADIIEILFSRSHPGTVKQGNAITTEPIFMKGGGVGHDSGKNLINCIWINRQKYFQLFF